ncbi:MAG: Haloacid dehalogenase domain protein hydrolase [Clostridia bacterium 62_21]|nr:MAG: Haloacid dehalogenase domain protein hydrolase [Clostridia bacterium 62_21]HAG07931.1 HAD family hydrolase [Peptococcaceae bacterium]
MRYRFLLFDLDGTLLPMDKNLFLNGYLDALSARLADYLPPNEFVRHLLGATRAMIDNTDPRRTNEEVFMEQFFTRTGLPPDAILPIFERFYRDEFPSLSRLTRPTPLARRVVSAALENGLTLAVATNAIFPRAAIEERLRWAGVADTPFRVITSYEIMHFCKPKPQYYEEIAALLGAEPEECLMVGNDVEEDMVAAETGMGTYLVEDDLIHRGLRPCCPDFRGRLKDLLLFLTGRGRQYP